MVSQTASIIAGIDIGSSTTRVIITEHVGDNVPRVIGIGKSETLGMSKGYVVHELEALKSLQQAITIAEKMADIRLERAYVSIGGISLETHHIQIPLELPRKEINHKDLTTLSQMAVNKFLQREKNKTVLHVIPLYYYLDGEEIHADPVGLSGNELVAEFSLVSCLSQHRDGLVSVVSKAGIDIIDVVASPVAAGVIALSKRSRVAGSALVDIGSETLTLAIFEHDALMHVAVIPCGAGLITHDLALGLQISLDQAELVQHGQKIDYLTNTPKRKVADIVEARIMDMLEIIQKKLTLWGRDRLLPGGITLIGGGSHNENIDTYARTFLKLPAQVVSPEKLIPSKRGLDASWFSVYGLCLLGDQEPEYRTSGITLKKFLKDARSMTKNFLEQFLP